MGLEVHSTNGKTAVHTQQQAARLTFRFRFLLMPRTRHRFLPQDLRLQSLTQRRGHRWACGKALVSLKAQRYGLYSAQGFAACFARILNARELMRWRLWLLPHVRLCANIAPARCPKHAFSPQWSSMPVTDGLCVRPTAGGVRTVAFWTDKKLAPSLPSTPFRYIETACQCRTDCTSGLYLACLPSFSGPTRLQDVIRTMCTLRLSKAHISAKTVVEF